MGEVNTAGSHLPVQMQVNLGGKIIASMLALPLLSLLQYFLTSLPNH